MLDKRILVSRPHWLMWPLGLPCLARALTRRRLH